MRKSRTLLAGLCLAFAAACGNARDELVVLAAASLAEPFREIGRDFTARHPDQGVLFSFAGSQILATQLRAGARADVIATANPELALELEREGLVAEPREFATNRIVWAFQRDIAPADATDLARRLPHSSWRLVVAAPEVPVGGYTQLALWHWRLLEPVEERLVSRELDVNGVLSKLRLGAADGGVVYASNVTRALHSELAVIEFPEAAQVRASYRAAAVLRGDRARARAFLDFLSDDGLRVLLRHGFGAPQ